MPLTKVTSGVRTLGTGEVTSANLAAGAVDTSGLEDDIALLGFKVASNGSLSKYNLVDQVVDDFVDATGVDASASTGEQHSGGAFGGAVGNYYGDGSDGAVSTAGNVTYTVANKNGSYDGDMVVKQYSSLTVNTGHTITTDQPCRGMFIYVSGDCTINGTISMSGKGPAADPTSSGGSDSNAVDANGLQIGLITSGGSSSFTNDGTGFNGCGTAVRTAIANQGDISSNGTIFTISRVGGAGGAQSAAPGDGGTAVGNKGTNGTTGAATISTGGGGGGGAIDISGGGDPSGPYGGAGGGASAFGGGSGGGGAQSRSHGGKTGGTGANYGGAGGNGDYEGGYNGAHGGSGNPGGNGVGGGSGGGAGTGGIIWLVVGGDLTISGTGVIDVRGVASDSDSSYAFGGGSGAGAVHALYKGTLSNSGSITGTNGTEYNNGGDGGLNTAQLGEIIQNMTLVSTATTAEAAPTKGDIVMTYSNSVGTASINVDITAEFSSDNGSTWTSATLVGQGTTGGHEIVSAHDITRTSTSGTSMRWRVKTLNQSAAKSTKIQAVSLGWS